MLNFVLDFIIRKISEYKEGLILNELNQILTYENGVVLLGYSEIEICNNTELLVETSKDAGPDLNVDKTKYIVTSGYR